MTAARRLAAILAADVSVREHGDGTSENRAYISFPPQSLVSRSTPITTEPWRSG
jgi:hypothetical protein